MSQCLSKQDVVIASHTNGYMERGWPEVTGKTSPKNKSTDWKGEEDTPRTKKESKGKCHPSVTPVPVLDSVPTSKWISLANVNTPFPPMGRGLSLSAEGTRLSLQIMPP